MRIFEKDLGQKQIFCVTQQQRSPLGRHLRSKKCNFSFTALNRLLIFTTITPSPYIYHFFMFTYTWVRALSLSLSPKTTNSSKMIFYKWFSPFKRQKDSVWRLDLPFSFHLSTFTTCLSLALSYYIDTLLSFLFPTLHIYL